MTLELSSLGTFTVHAGPSWRFSRGPLGTRSVSEFEGVTWESERVRARSVWANGTYRSGETIAEVHVRAMLETDDEAMLYIDYLGRFRRREMGAGGREIMSGRIETADERYDWLNATQVVGKGTLFEDTMTYELYALE